MPLADIAFLRLHGGVEALAIGGIAGALHQVAGGIGDEAHRGEMVAVQELPGRADHLDVHMRIARERRRRPDRVFDVRRRIQRRCPAGDRLAGAHGIRPVGERHGERAGHDDRAEAIGLIPAECARPIAGRVAVGVIGKGSRAERQRCMRARRRRHRIGEGAARRKPRPRQQVADAVVGERLRQRRVAGIGGAHQPVERVVAVAPVLRRRQPVDRGDAPCKVAHIGRIKQRRAAGVPRDDARQPAPSRRIGELRVDAVGIVDSPRLAVGLECRRRAATKKPKGGPLTTRPKQASMQSENRAA